jgi:hypothetical protein
LASREGFERSGEEGVAVFGGAVDGDVAGGVEDPGYEGVGEERGFGPVVEDSGVGEADG